MVLSGKGVFENMTSKMSLKFEGIKEASALESLSTNYNLNLIQEDQVDIPTQIHEKVAFIANINHVVALSLFDCNLKEFPLEITQFKKLRYLYLKNNSIQTLPDEIRNLEKLKLIFLNDNQLKELNPEIKHLKRLDVLNLSNNNLSELPEELYELSYLTLLDVSGNGIERLSEDIYKLKILESLDFSNNKLSIIPNSLLDLHYLKFISLFGNDTLPQKFSESNSISEKRRTGKRELEELLKPKH